MEVGGMHHAYLDLVLNIALNVHVEKRLYPSINEICDVLIFPIVKLPFLSIDKSGNNVSVLDVPIPRHS